MGHFEADLVHVRRLSAQNQARVQVLIGLVEPEEVLPESSAQPAGSEGHGSLGVGREVSGRSRHVDLVRRILEREAALLPCRNEIGDVGGIDQHPFRPRVRRHEHETYENEEKQQSASVK